MHVTCSNCGARYIVDPLAIGPTGRTVQCARCNNRWFERASPASAAILRERVEQAQARMQDAVERAQGQDEPEPTYRSGLPAIARPQVRRPRWPYWIAAVVLLAVALGAVLVFRGDLGTKSPLPWRATGLSLDPPPAPARWATAETGRAMPRATPRAGTAGEGRGSARVDIGPAIE